MATPTFQSRFSALLSCLNVHHTIFMHIIFLAGPSTQMSTEQEIIRIGKHLEKISSSDTPVRCLCGIRVVYCVVGFN